MGAGSYFFNSKTGLPSTSAGSVPMQVVRIGHMRMGVLHRLVVVRVAVRALGHRQVVVGVVAIGMLVRMFMVHGRVPVRMAV